MATNPYVNKVEVDGVTLIDLTQDTVTAGYLYAGIVAHAADGSAITGTVADGDPIAYGLNTSPRVNVAQAGFAVVTDNDTDITGHALTEYAVLSA